MADPMTSPEDEYSTRNRPRPSGSADRFEISGDDWKRRLGERLTGGRHQFELLRRIKTGAKQVGPQNDRGSSRPTPPPPPPPPQTPRNPTTIYPHPTQPPKNQKPQKKKPPNKQKPAQPHHPPPTPPPTTPPTPPPHGARAMTTGLPAHRKIIVTILDYGIDESRDAYGRGWSLDRGERDARGRAGSRTAPVEEISPIRAAEFAGHCSPPQRARG